MAANLSVVLGPRAMTAFGDQSGESGKAAFAAQQHAMAKESGSVGLGKEHDKPFVPKLANVPEKTPVDAPKLNVGGKVGVPAGKGGTKKPVAKPGKKPGKKEPPLSFTEADAERLLEADPNAWPKIAESESERAEGPRLHVVQLLVKAGPLATVVPMPPEILASLESFLTLQKTGE